LTDNGRQLAERVRPLLAHNAFALILCSPMQRAREACALAGLDDQAVIDPDLMEWNYGDYEGLTPKQIQDMAPGWLIFRDGCRVARHLIRSLPALTGDCPVASGRRRHSRTDTCSASSGHGGSGCRQAPDNISCSTQVL